MDERDGNIFWIFHRLVRQAEHQETHVLGYPRLAPI